VRRVRAKGLASAVRSERPGCARFHIRSSAVRMQQFLLLFVALVLALLAQ